jgi:hypothetical protein
MEIIYIYIYIIILILILILQQKNALLPMKITRKEPNDRCCAHIIRITNDGAGNNWEDGEIKRYGESLAPFCLPMPYFGPCF